LIKSIIPRIVVLAVVVAISIFLAGLSAGQLGGNTQTATTTVSTNSANPCAPAAPATGSIVGIAATSHVVLVDVEPHGDNEHFGVANVGTSEVDLGGFGVAIDDATETPLPTYSLKPGEEVNIVLAQGASANEGDEKDLFIGTAGHHLNDTAGRIVLRDSAGWIHSEVTYSHPEPAAPAVPARPPTSSATPGNSGHID
jgi:hypothetical protein